MLTIENTQVTGWEPAIRGMRNPLLSYDRSDSWFRHSDLYYHKITGETCSVDELIDPDDLTPDYILGPNDKDLMRRLAKAGTDHAKYRRMIMVTFDLTAPLFYWKEFDTYKVGTVANSTSTMHKIQAKEFTLDDFSHEHLSDFARDYILGETIHELNVNRTEYLNTGDKQYWWGMIELLPSSYNQKRTIELNYEVLANIYPARKNHRLDDWHTFCDWIESLPESWIITGEETITPKEE